MRYLAWTAAVCCVSRMAFAADPLHLPKLGPQSVGAPMSKVAGYVRGQNCVFRRDYADCSVRDPRSGVEYVVFEKNVTIAIAESQYASSAKLPYGIHFEDSMATVLQKLPANNEQDWTSGSDFITSPHQYIGENDWSFGLELHFQAGALVKVVYRSGSI